MCYLWHVLFIYSRLLTVTEEHLEDKGDWRSYGGWMDSNKRLTQLLWNPC
jgi:hypothetical protein